MVGPGISLESAVGASEPSESLIGNVPCSLDFESVSATGPSTD